MRKLILLVFLYLILSGCNSGDSISPINSTDWQDPDYPGGKWLRVEGSWIKSSQNENIVLRGIAVVDLMVCEHQQFPYIGGFKGIIDKVTDSANDWFTKVIRLTVWPDGQKLIGEPGWVPDPETYYRNYLKPATDYCGSKNLYFIIDWHMIANYDEEEIIKQTQEFWKYIAPLYANEPLALFELFNEPINPDDWGAWKSFAQPLVERIRSDAPHNLIIVGNPRWSSDTSGALSNPITSWNIIYSCHIYPAVPWSQWDRKFGDLSRYRPIFMTEWTFEHPDPNLPLANVFDSDEAVTDGIRSFNPLYGPRPGEPSGNGYGDHFREYIDERPNINWTYWCADNQWQMMFDENWNLRGTEYFSGEFAKEWLFDKRFDNNPY